MMVTRTPQPNGLKVKQLRQSRGWTQLGLAEASGVSIGTIWNIEGVKKRNFPQNLVAVAETFGVTLQDLQAEEKSLVPDLTVETRLLTMRSKRFRKLWLHALITHGATYQLETGAALPILLLCVSLTAEIVWANWRSL